MRSMTRATTLMTTAILALCAGSADATTVQDLVRIKGLEENVLTGMGIVIGLDGTGDTSRQSLVAARPYARLLSNLGNPISDVEELARADAFAIVSVTMRVPAAGVREGDRLDVSVDKLFNAESLAGGRLVFSLLRLPLPDAPDLVPMAFAEGPLVVDPARPGGGIVRAGGQMLVDVRTDPVSENGTLTLVLDGPYATYPVAATLAATINDEFAIDGLSDIAVVEDARNIRIQIPREDRGRPAPFIAALMVIPIDPTYIRTEARIVINEREGIIAATADVEIGPVAITHRGLQLSALGDAPPPVRAEWLGLDTTDRASRNSTRLTDLLSAFRQLNLSAADQIAIIYELKQTGALHAEIVGP